MHDRRVRPLALAQRVEPAGHGSLHPSGKVFSLSGPFHYPACHDTPNCQPQGILRLQQLPTLRILYGCFLQIIILVMYFARLDLASEFLSVVTAAQVLLLYWRIQFWARAFQPLKNRCAVCSYLCMLMLCDAMYTYVCSYLPCSYLFCCLRMPSSTRIGWA